MGYAYSRYNFTPASKVYFLIIQMYTNYCCLTAFVMALVLEYETKTGSSSSFMLVRNSNECLADERLLWYQSLLMSQLTRWKPVISTLQGKSSLPLVRPMVAVQALYICGTIWRLYSSSFLLRDKNFYSRSEWSHAKNAAIAFFCRRSYLNSSSNLYLILLPKRTFLCIWLTSGSDKG